MVHVLGQYILRILCPIILNIAHKSKGAERSKIFPSTSCVTKLAEQAQRKGGPTVQVRLDVGTPIGQAFPFIFAGLFTTNKPLSERRYQKTQFPGTIL